MMPVLGTIAAWLARAGISSRIAQALAWAIVLLLAAGIGWGAWSIWLGRHDRSVIAQDRAAGTAEVLGNVIAADRSAGAAKGERDQAFGNEQSNLEEKVDAAVRNRTSALDALANQLQ